jgi:hypothetical protein
MMHASITRATYASLPQAQPRQLRHRLDVSIELSLYCLHKEVLGCLEDCVLKAVKPATAVKPAAVECSHCKGATRKVNTNGRCSSCGNTTALPFPADLQAFQLVWSGANAAEKAVSEGPGRQQPHGPLTAALGGMQAADLRMLLEAVIQPAIDSAAKASSVAAKARTSPAHLFY